MRDVNCLISNDMTQVKLSDRHGSVSYLHPWNFKLIKCSSDKHEYNFHR